MERHGTDRAERQVLVVVGWVRRDGQALLVRRHDPALAGGHGKWELPGGKLGFGEHPATAFAREIVEETGYQVEVVSLFPYVYSTIWEYPDRRQHTIVLVFDCRPTAWLGEPADPRIAEVAWREIAAIDFDRALPGVRDFVTWWQDRHAP